MNRQDETSKPINLAKTDSHQSNHVAATELSEISSIDAHVTKPNNTHWKRKRADILVIDDQPDNLNLLISMLNSAGYKTRPAMSGEMGLRAAKAVPPDLILLDINMPDLNGYEICRQLKQDNILKEIPVIFISARIDTIDKLKAFQSGGVDYITKPFHFEEVRARIHTHLTIRRQQLSIQATYEQEERYLKALHDTKDEFLRMLSHDLKNPISAIILFARLMAKRCPVGDPKAEKYLQAILDTTGRMAQLVTELLDLARIESGVTLKKERVELFAFLEKQTKLFQIQAEQKQQALEYIRPNTTCFLDIDSSAIQQVMSNLLSNAIKYTPVGGHIQISATQTPNSVTIIVQDNGPGIDEPHLPHIFDRFYQVKQNISLGTDANNDTIGVLENEEESTGLNLAIETIEEGTGLGLTIVKTLVEQHEGNVWVESPTQDGTLFFVELPK